MAQRDTSAICGVLVMGYVDAGLRDSNRDNYLIVWAPYV